MQDFKIYIPMSKGLESVSSPIIESSPNGETKTRFKFSGIASTSSLDRDRERVSKACMLSMAKKINEKKLPIFGNHEHNWEDMLGFSSSAEVRNDELHIEILTDFAESNPKILQLIGKMNAGMPLGLSIGGKVVKSHDAYEASIKEEIKVIDDVDLLETSIVGIAANPDAFLSIPAQIAKSLRNGFKNNSEEINLENVQKSSGQSGIASYGKLGETTIEARCPVCGKPSEFREIANGAALYVCTPCDQRFSVELPRKAEGTEPESQPEKTGANPIDRQDQEVIGRTKSIKNYGKGGKMVSLNKGAEGKPADENESNQEDQQEDDNEYKAFKEKVVKVLKELETEAMQKQEGQTTTPGGENADAKNRIGGSGGAGSQANSKSLQNYDLMKKAIKENLGVEGLTAKKVEESGDISFKRMKENFKRRF